MSKICVLFIIYIYVRYNFFALSYTINRSRNYRFRISAAVNVRRDVARWRNRVLKHVLSLCFSQCVRTTDARFKTIPISKIIIYCYYSVLFRRPLRHASVSEQIYHSVSEGFCSETVRARRRRCRRGTAHNGTRAPRSPRLRRTFGGRPE